MYNVCEGDLLSVVIKWLSLRPLLPPEAQSRVGVTAYIYDAILVLH